MFQEYHKAVEVAQGEENAKNEEYDNLKEALTIEIKTKMESECKIIQQNSHLKDYSPIKHYNEMTELRHKYDRLNTDLETEKQEIKAKLHQTLGKLMPEQPPKITEMYKVIGAASGMPSLICRVWFTLVPVPTYECVPGDPIRVEWINLSISNYTRKNDKSDGVSKSHSRCGTGINGLQIPEFSHLGPIVGGNNLYPITQWGETSQYVTRWKQWIQDNRPL